MFRKNKYIFRSKLSEDQFLRLLDFFCADFNASEISGFIGLSRNTVNKIIAALRVRIFQKALASQSRQRPMDPNKIHEKLQAPLNDTDTMVPILAVGFLGERLYTHLFPKFPITVFGTFVCPHTPIEFRSTPKILRSFYLLTELHGKKRYTVLNKGKLPGETEKKRKEIARFHSFLRMRMTKFRGAKEETLPFHCMESEFRYNHRFDNLFQILASDLASNPLRIKESLEVYGTVQKSLSLPSENIGFGNKSDTENIPY